jgi:enediyne biosynthesis protein E4
MLSVAGLVMSRSAWIVLLIALAPGCTSQTSQSAAPQLAPVPESKEHAQGESPFAGAMEAPESIAAAPLRDAFTTTQPGMPVLVDVHAEAGIEFIYENGATGRNLMVEATGGGAGWLDYDGDQRWDLYLVQGGDPEAAIDDPSQPVDRLFRNLGAGVFRDVTAGVRIHELRYGQGVAVADYDDDGFDDIYVTNVGPNRLYRNQGDGTFLETTLEAGVGDPRWSSSAAWGDLDLDGDLDLYIGNYCAYDPLDPVDCRDKHGAVRICHPKNVTPWPDECMINQGDGTFTRESQERNLFGEGNRALGVAIADFNNDGWPDVYVANDTTPNFLFVNQQNGTFVESASWLGCAVDRKGDWQASMGLGIGDYDHNGWLDIYSTHYREESNTLYRNLGAGGFQDVTGLTGLHEPTLPVLGFGTVMTDLDHDGRLDLFVTNGHIDPAERVYQMPPQLFIFDGPRWRDASHEAGEFFQRKLVGRGVAMADFDDDGDLDLAVVHQNSLAALLRNDSPPRSWLKIRFRGRQSNRRGIGARATVWADGASRMQELCGGTSYASSHQSELNFGLGDYQGSVSVEVRWPLGAVQTLEGVAVNQLLILDEPPG